MEMLDAAFWNVKHREDLAIAWNQEHMGVECASGRIGSKNEFLNWTHQDRILPCIKQALEWNLHLINHKYRKSDLKSLRRKKRKNFIVKVFNQKSETSLYYYKMQFKINLLFSYIGYLTSKLVDNYFFMDQTHNLRHTCMVGMAKLYDVAIWTSEQFTTHYAVRKFLNTVCFIS